MTTFTVTTSKDIVDANDGLISLREAVGLAEARAGADTIKFSAGVKTVELTGGRLTIAGGELTIDGDRNNDGVADVAVDAQQKSNHLEVLSGATVTIDGLILRNGSATGANGAAGADGRDAPPRVTASPNGNPGFAGDAGSVGGAASGSIINGGDLTLVHTVIANSIGTGGTGGAGGTGGDGDVGIRVGGFAGRGGAGGDGGTGGEGGVAAGGVLNLAGASLHLVDVSFDGLTGIGGQGGNGGVGGNGGRGANGGASGGRDGDAGQGGDGGDAGAPGRGGTVSSTVLNYGSVDGSGKIETTAGVGTPRPPAGASAGGAGGAGGAGTRAGESGPEPYQAPNGANGAPSPGGGIGDSGFTIVGGTGGGGGKVYVGNALIYINGTDLVHTEGSSGTTTYTFHINRYGASDTNSVSYAVTPVEGLSGADFVGGALPSGTVTFSPGQKSIAVTFQVLGDTQFENDEYFTVDLSNPTKNAVIGTSSAEGVILGDDVIARLYATTTRATLLEELYTADDLVEVAARISDGQVLDISAGARVPRDLVIAGNNVTVSSTGETTASLVLGAGVTAITLEGDAAFTAAGNAGANLIKGNAGANIIDGLAGVDTMQGGGGSDDYYVDSAGDRVIEAAGGGADSVFTSTSYTLAARQEIENLSATNQSGTDGFRLTGNEFDNVITGNAGANAINGGTGADLMSGLGAGDTYYVDNGGDRVFESFEGGADLIFTSVSFAIEAGQEVERLYIGNDRGTDSLSLTGNEIVNLIKGNDGANVIDGGGSADLMYGLGGSDTYYVDVAGDRVFEAAGGGADLVLANADYTLAAGQEIERLFAVDTSQATPLKLTGNEIANLVRGNFGANVLNGAGGADTLTGFRGQDTFVFDTAPAANAIDHITDFAIVDDTIQLSRSAFSAIAAGPLGSGAFKDLRAPGAVLDDSDRIIYNRQTGALFYDADGSGRGFAQVQFATLDTKVLISHEDFVIV